jgi:serine/threonine protein kinase/tetratricopeptide (TPR) repeat protein
LIGQSVAHYRIEARLGEGGMGVVYAAVDERLERRVALKLIRGDDPRLRDRFWREARAAAQVNHPGICQVHEVGELQGEPFIVMELLEGETMGDRIARAPLPVPEAVRVGTAVLDALGALHRRGLVHRDVKPTNVFLLADGRVKLLDFGLVATGGDGAAAPGPALTMTGVIVGSPRYMSPEQIRGGQIDGRTDLFALAAVLFEAVTGRPAFGGRQPIDTMYAVLHDPPPRLEGSSEHEALGRVVARALAKTAEERHPTADAMAADLRSVLETATTPNPNSIPAPPPLARLAVLPFRMLRPDPELDFLGPSLADAIALSLAGIRSLVVRSTIASARYEGATPELGRIAAELDVDTILFGTILPHGERCRVVAQLVEAPGGRVVWSQTSDISGRDAFHLQDEITRRIVDSLQLPLSARERRGLDRNAPASATAYELFLRANRSVMGGQELDDARDLYQRGLELDPHFAPAWARLGHCHRVLGKYVVRDRTESYRLAQEALGRALTLDPDHPNAHHVQAIVDLDMGRTEEALERLLGVVERNPNDPAGYAGLVTALRYAGLLEESRVAHERARRLDPEVRTSIGLTLEALGEWESALEEFTREQHYDRPVLLLMMGRTEEAARDFDGWAEREKGNLLGDWAKLVRALMKRDQAVAEPLMDLFVDFPDPEGQYHTGGLAAWLTGDPRMVETVVRGITGGYFCIPGITRDPRVDSLRRDPEFVKALEVARARHEAALARFRAPLRRLLQLPPL